MWAALLLLSGVCAGDLLAVNDAIRYSRSRSRVLKAPGLQLDTGTASDASGIVTGGARDLAPAEAEKNAGDADVYRRALASTASAPGEAPASPEADPAADPPPMSLKTARLNFGTVVETFVIRNSVEGLWLVPDRKAGKDLPLTFERIEDESVHQVIPGHFAGRAVLREAGSDRPVSVQFLVNFSGSKWLVENLRLWTGTPQAWLMGPKAEARPAAKVVE